MDISFLKNDNMGLLLKQIQGALKTGFNFIRNAQITISHSHSEIPQSTQESGREKLRIPSL